MMCKTMQYFLREKRKCVVMLVRSFNIRIYKQQAQKMHVECEDLSALIACACFMQQGEYFHLVVVYVD